MSKVTAKEFSADVSSAIMRKGATGINHILTQYMFGEKKFLDGLLFKVTDDKERMVVVNKVVNDLQKAYQAGGEHSLTEFVTRLIETSAAKKNGMEVF